MSHTNSLEEQTKGMKTKRGEIMKTHLILNHPHSFLPHLKNNAKDVNILILLNVLKNPVESNKCTRSTDSSTKF